MAIFLVLHTCRPFVAFPYLSFAETPIHPPSRQPKSVHLLGRAQSKYQPEQSSLVHSYLDKHGYVYIYIYMYLGILASKWPRMSIGARHLSRLVLPCLREMKNHSQMASGISGHHQRECPAFVPSCRYQGWGLILRAPPPWAPSLLEKNPWV